MSHQQILRKNSKFLNFTPENNNNVNGDETVFESFLGGDEHVYYKNLKKKSSFLNNNLNTPLGSNNAIILNNAELNEKADLPECIQEFKSYYPLKYVNDFFFWTIKIFFLGFLLKQSSLESNSHTFKRNEKIPTPIFERP